MSGADRLERDVNNGYLLSGVYIIDRPLELNGIMFYDVTSPIRIEALEQYVCKCNCKSTPVYLYRDEYEDRHVKKLSVGEMKGDYILSKQGSFTKAS